MPYLYRFKPSGEPVEHVEVDDHDWALATARSRAKTSEDWWVVSANELPDPFLEFPEGLHPEIRYVRSGQVFRTDQFAAYKPRGAK